MKNPQVGDIVLHNNECRAQVIRLGSIVTNNGVATLYSIKFFQGMIPVVNCQREEFTFPASTK